MYYWKSVSEARDMMSEVVGVVTLEVFSDGSY